MYKQLFSQNTLLTPTPCPSSGRARGASLQDLVRHLPGADVSPQQSVDDPSLLSYWQTYSGLAASQINTLYKHNFPNINNQTRPTDIDKWNATKTRQWIMSGKRPNNPQAASDWLHSAPCLYFCSVFTDWNFLTETEVFGNCSRLWHPIKFCKFDW